MVMYLNLHMALEQMRQKAENSESEIGPRVSRQLVRRLLAFMPYSYIQCSSDVSELRICVSYERILRILHVQYCSLPVACL